MISLKRSDAVAKINETNGKIFSALVIKRTDGSQRWFRARLARNTNVGKVGGKLNYDAKSKGLIPVYVMPGDDNRKDDAKENYRMIAVDGLVTLTVDGVDYRIVD